MDLFGISVAISGDTAVIGALLDDGAGSANVFTRTGAVWTQQPKLTAFDAAAGDQFGICVSISGDTAIVGANGNDDGGSASGAAYVFTRTGVVWSPQQKLTASDAAAGDNFGVSVAVSAETVLVGAYQDDGVGADSGAAYVFACAPTVLTPCVAPAPFDRPKNRYISFTPGSGADLLAFRVQKTTAPTGSCWVQAPVAAGADINTAACGANPVFRVWNEPVIHCGDCEIIPVADYMIFANAPGPIENPTGLAVSTILVPNLNLKLWGDNVGINNGIEWTAPNQFTNVNDVLSLLAFISGAAIRPQFTVANLQAISSADSCLNAFVNTSDILISVRAIAGDSYGPPATGKITNPANCPVCP